MFLCRCAVRGNESTMALRLLQGYESDSSSENEAGATSSTSVKKSELGKSPVSSKNETRKSDPSPGKISGSRDKTCDSLVFENPMNRLDSDETVLRNLNTENSDSRSDNVNESLFDKTINRINAITEAKFSEQQNRADKYGSDGEKSSSTDSADDSDNNWESFDDSDDDILG